jgi:hypothetical protein
VLRLILAEGGLHIDGSAWVGGRVGGWAVTTRQGCTDRSSGQAMIVAAVAIGARRLSLAQGRRALAWALGIGGLIAYNWWALVPFKPGLLRSPDEFFSNLEVTGQPYATVMQHLDVLSGLLILAAFALAGLASISNGRREWLGMIVFAMSGLIGGLFPQVCEDGVSIACLDAERHFQLPLSQYVHDGAGIIEYVGITLALLLAVRRTRSQHDAPARAYRALAIGAAVMYPILGLTYMINKLGAVVEGTFFVGFAVMVVVQLQERLTQKRLPVDRAGRHTHDYWSYAPWRGARH